MKYKNSLFIAIFLLLTTVGYANPNQDEQNYITYMSTHYHFNTGYLDKLILPLHADPRILASITHPYEMEPWYVYRRGFVTQERIEHGVEYWHKHAVALATAKKKYGVDPAIIVAIVGVESYYGHERFKYSALSSLVTLSFYYSPRSEYFKEELTDYLLLTRERKLNPRTVLSSYAGALGLPQFMPSSYREFAVSYGNRNTRDLLHDTGDVVMSVANYLHDAGWEAGGLVAMPATVVGDKYRLTFATKAEPSMTVKELSDYGVYPNEKIDPNIKAALLSLEKADGSFEYWLIFHNFYSILRYNGSKLYAMVVCQLANELLNSTT